MLENNSIQFLKGVGEKRAEQFAKLGVDSVGALLTFYPRDYEDYSDTVAISDAPAGEKCCIKGKVLYTPNIRRTSNGMTIYETRVSDGASALNITIFNNRYLAEKLISGNDYLFLGKMNYDAFGRSMVSPKVMDIGSNEKIKPIYHCTSGLNSNYIEKCVKTAFRTFGDEIEETLPEEIIKRYNLTSYRAALHDIHFPGSFESLKRAGERLVFDELFFFELGLMSMSFKKGNSTDVVIDKDYTAEFYKKLPFKLTKDQTEAVKDIITDMASGTAMMRLLQGDVGCGKTVVAAAAAYTCAKNGIQTALMAPTEILAGQHIKTLGDFFEGTGINVALLSGSMNAKKKKEIKEKLLSGEIDVIVGTHALIQNDVKFKNLGFVITDEQHRFGVSQRQLLSEKGNNVHTLVMSATPIPRTLALSIYGDLDISAITEKPSGRLPVETYKIDSSKRQRAYKYIDKFLKEGHQCYIICPMVEEGENDGLANVKDYADFISKNEFKNYRVGLLHGKMSGEKKDKIRQEFADGLIDILVCTTVVEVGVDVPNAVIILIENAERFGLSTLHQLRGRVGRSSSQSTCILLTDSNTKATYDRMNILCKTDDGFKVAAEDLKSRGPGDFFGSRQHGLPELKLANLLESTKTLEQVQKEASIILKDDPYLKSDKNKKLKAEVDRLFETPAGI